MREMSSEGYFRSGRIIRVKMGAASLQENKLCLHERRPAGRKRTPHPTKDRDQRGSITRDSTTHLVFFFPLDTSTPTTHETAASLAMFSVRVKQKHSESWLSVISVDSFSDKIKHSRVNHPTVCVQLKLVTILLVLRNPKFKP